MRRFFSSCFLSLFLSLYLEIWIGIILYLLLGCLMAILPIHPSWSSELLSNWITEVTEYRKPVLQGTIKNVSTMICLFLCSEKALKKHFYQWMLLPLFVRIFLFLKVYLIIYLFLVIILSLFISLILAHLLSLVHSLFLFTFISLQIVSCSPD